MTDLALRLWHRLLRRIGPRGLLGLGLIVLAGGLAAWAPRLQQDAEQLSRDAENLQRSTALERDARARMPSTHQQLQQFMAAFPDTSQNADDLRRIFDAAQRHHLQLAKGEYQFSAEPRAPFVTYAATFPIRDGYAHIKAFAADVLQSLPHAQLDELRLERGDAGATQLDARIRITLVYRSS